VGIYEILKVIVKNGWNFGELGGMTAYVHGLAMWRHLKIVKPGTAAE
jgi:hypothetical protein